MAGAYCKFCDHRCFVYRIVPAGEYAGWSGHMATCTRGMEHTRSRLGGYDSSSSTNPFDEPDEEC